MGFYLSMNSSCYGQVPGCVGRHSKAKERPNPIVMERRYEHCSGTASSKDISPSPLVQIVIDVIYVAEKPTAPTVKITEIYLIRQ